MLCVSRRVREAVDQAVAVGIALSWISLARQESRGAVLGGKDEK